MIIDHRYCQQIQEMFFRIRIKDYFDILLGENMADRDMLLKCRECINDFSKHVTQVHMYSFDNLYSTCTKDITIGEVMLVISSLFNKETDSDPENITCEDPVGEMTAIAEEAITALLSPLVSVGQRMKERVKDNEFKKA